MDRLNTLCNKFISTLKCFFLAITCLPAGMASSKFHQIAKAIFRNIELVLTKNNLFKMQSNLIHSVLNYRVLPLLILCLLGCWGCEDTTVYTPKPRAFPRVIYPERTYEQFDESYCDFSFTYPGYASVQQDTLFFDEKPAHPCWFDLNYPDFNARLYCTYYPIDKNNTFERLREDTYRMANKHIVKANAIDEIPIENNQEIGGFVFRYKGPTATPLSFFLTDTTDNYLNGALYFQSRPRPDSLAPVLAFIQEDIEKMIASFKWKK